MTVLFEEQTVPGFSMSSVGFFMAVLGAPAPFVLEADREYTVIWDGVEYTRTAFAFIDISSGAPFVGIGNTILTDGISNSGEPFGITYNADFGDTDGMFAFAVDTQESHTIGIYLPDPGIILRDRVGNEMEFSGVESFVVDTTVDGGTAVFSKGEAVETTIDLDFSGGDMIVAEDGKLFSAVNIPVPDGLVPENIPKGVVVAGIVGSHEGGGGLIDVVNTTSTSATDQYKLMTGVRSFTFTKLKTISTQGFYKCTDLVKVDLHAITALTVGLFWTTKLETLIIRTSTMCSLPANQEAMIFDGAFNATVCIYVPASLLSTYKADSGWSNYADRIFAIEDYPEICG